MEGSAGKGWCSHTQFADCLSPSSCSGGGGVRVQPHIVAQQKVREVEVA